MAEVSAPSPDEIQIQNPEGESEAIDPPEKPALTEYEKSLHPNWGGINFQTAVNLCFATPEQLLLDYKKCIVRGGVPGGVIQAWMNWSYKGEALQDKTPEGEGTGTMVGGLKYTGRLKKGLMHGQGELEFGSGLVYKGQFFYNQIHGSGSYRWLNGANYVGEVFHGLPHGTGTLHTGENGFCTYEGTWSKGLRHGQGRLVYGKEGEATYYGGWENDRKHGEGNLIYSTGSTYRGGWAEGKRHGDGRCVVVISSLPKGPSAALRQKHWRLDAAAVQIYDGEWGNDLPHGSGTDVWADDGVEENKYILRNRYVGSFLDGQRNGDGVFYYASGAIFKGLWKENMKDGPGYLTYEDGKIHGGAFTRNHYSSSKDESLSVKEPLDTVIEFDSDITVMKKKVSELLLRKNTKLCNIFNSYSYFPEKPTNDTNARQLGRPRALLLEQIWQLSHDIRIVEPGFGLAQIDAVLRANPEAWNNFPDIHHPGRQFIFREFLEIIIKLARCKNTSDSPLVAKVDEFLQSKLSLESGTCGKDSPYTLVASDPVQRVFEDFKPQMHQFFNETLREVGTSDGTIKILYLNMFFQRFAPDLVEEQGKVICKMFSALYYVTLNEEEDNSMHLDYDINYRECELCLLVIATLVRALFTFSN